MDKRLKDTLNMLGAWEYIPFGDDFLVTFKHERFPPVKITDRTRVEITNEIVKIIDERGPILVIRR